MKKRILMLFLVLAVLLSAFTLTVSAAEIIDSGTCGENLTWELTADGNLHISGTGEMTESPWRGYHQETITSVTIDEGVTSIGESAFLYCPNMANITIPKSVSAIGEGAFAGCESLISVTIPEGVTSIGISVFDRCYSLTSITIPKSVTDIGDSAFAGCESLTDVTIPNNVTSIGQHAFMGCKSLTSITIPDSVTEIDYYAFFRCTGLTSVNISENVSFISDHAFDCRIFVDEGNPDYSSDDAGVLFNKEKTELLCVPVTISGNYTIPTSVTSILGDAFRDCTSLTGVTIPVSVTSIGDYAFEDCTGLTDVYYDGTDAQWNAIEISCRNGPLILAKTKVVSGTCGKNLSWTVTADGNLNISGTGEMETSFSAMPPWLTYWNAITTVTIDDGVTSIGYCAFYECTNMTNISIPGSVTSIGMCAFGYCTSLTNITIPEGVTSIDKDAFLDCTSLTSINIPDSITSIGESNFRNCTSLTSITIPEGVTSIGHCAFDGCTSLTNVTIPDSVTFIDFMAFNGCTSLTDVYYRGTEEQWNLIENPDPYSPLINTPVHFNATILPSVPDISTSVANSEFVQQVESAKEDAYIVADYSGEVTLPETAFSAIAGTNKTLDLVSDGVTWRFNGNDIVNEVKSIDLNVEIMPVEEHPSDAAQQIQSALEDKPAVVMQFPENGTLPGKATIQVKVDQAMKEYLGSNQGLWVYYFNDQTGELELIAKDLVVVNDTYVEFSITHCSNYVLTPGIAKFPFVDVPNGIWYLNPVFWAVENGITNGMTATTFAPDNECTRGQIVTFLWRANGSPAPESANNPFADVKPEDFYYKAVLWAVEKGITTGTSATTFSPDASCTRGQVATFLHRTQGTPAPGGENIFSDLISGAYYYDAVLWAVENGITNGMGNGTFAPDATCTRGQIVTFLYRAMV